MLASCLRGAFSIDDKLIYNHSNLQFTVDISDEYLTFTFRFRIYMHFIGAHAHTRRLSYIVDSKINV